MVARRTVNYVESSPEDQRQPRHWTLQYAKPGDQLDLENPVLFSVDPVQQIDVSNELFPNPYELSNLVWRKDGRGVTFEYNQRGHQLYRIIEVAAATGEARALLSEEAKTFFYYNNSNDSRSSGKRFRHDVDDGKEVIWMSEGRSRATLGRHYSTSSNVDNAHRLQGRLLLVVGELDTNVDPASTIQVVHALFKASKTFDLLMVPGENHGAARSGTYASYGLRKQLDFFVQHLMGVTPPDWNVPATKTTTDNKRWRDQRVALNAVTGHELALKLFTASAAPSV